MSLQLQKNASLQPPLVPRPTEDDPVGIVWIPYLLEGHAPMSAPRCVGSELAKLAEITINIPSQSFCQKTGMTIDELWVATNEIHFRLFKCYDNLPGMQPHQVPHAIYLQ